LAVLSVGRICVKTRGREAGSKCVIVNVIDRSFVEVTGPRDLTGVKRRKVNVSHLTPLDKALKIRKGTSDKVVLSALRRSRLVPFMSGEKVGKRKGVAKAEEADSP